MEPNEASVRRRPPRWWRTRTLGINTASLPATAEGMTSRVSWALAEGFGGIELAATGRDGDLYAPQVKPDERARLADLLAPFDAVAVQAPTQETLDVSLVSPSAAVRRASVAEIWSALRLAQAIRPGAIVTVRTGRAPRWVEPERRRDALAECLATLDRMAGDHDVSVAVAAVDFFERPEHLALLEALPLRHTGIALDTGRFARRPGNGRRGAGGGIGDFVRTGAARLLHVHLHDADPEDDGLALGRGGLDVPALAAALEEVDYQGMVSFTFDRALVSPDQIRDSKRRWERLATGAAGDR